jgi:hypothetical protein
MLVSGEICERREELRVKLVRCAKIEGQGRAVGEAVGHIHDPVDEHKLATWMQVPPNSWQIVQEPFREGRLLAYYNLIEGPSAHFDKEFIFRAIAERASFAP